MLGGERKRSDSAAATGAAASHPFMRALSTVLRLINCDWWLVKCLRVTLVDYTSLNKWTSHTLMSVKFQWMRRSVKNTAACCPRFNLLIVLAVLFSMLLSFIENEWELVSRLGSQYITEKEREREIWCSVQVCVCVCVCLYWRDRRQGECWPAVLGGSSLPYYCHVSD